MRCHETKKPIPPMPYHLRKQHREKQQRAVMEKLWKRWRNDN